MSEDEIQGSFWDHVEDLRKTLIRVLLVVFCATALSFTFYQEILSFLTLPLSVLNEGVKEGSLTATPYQIVRQKVSNTTRAAVPYQVAEGMRVIAINGVTVMGDRAYVIEPDGWLETEQLKAPDQLILLGPIDGFRTALKACFWFALVASSPLWLYFIFQFIAPALHVTEKSLALPVILFCLIFLVMGMAFGFFVSIPIANRCLFSFNTGIGQNLWTLSLYLDYTVLLLLANALAFELSAILLLLVHYGVVTATWLIAKRRHMYVAIFILSALLTPPDVFTLLLMAFPLCGLFELIVLYARWCQKLVSHTAPLLD